MNSISMLLLFATFGGVCGFYVSVVGFTITALALSMAIGIISLVTDGPLSFPILVGAFIAQQIGYMFSVLSRALVLHIARFRQRPRDSVAEVELRAEQDRSR